MINKKGWKIAILGNPFHLTLENCQRMYVCGVRKYQLSLDGLEETHDRIRMKGSYKETISKVKVL